MITPRYVAERLLENPRYIEDIRASASLCQEDTIVPGLQKQHVLLQHPAVHETSHARVHIPYFTSRMCDIAHAVLDRLTTLSGCFEKEILHGHLEMVLPSSAKIKDVRLDAKPWKAGQFLLQMKIDMGVHVFSRSLRLDTEWATRAQLMRRHVGNGAVGVHFIVPLEGLDIDALHKTSTMIIQVWLGTPDSPDVAVGTMYASDVYPDESSAEDDNTTGILFKTYRSDSDRIVDAQLFVKGIKRRVDALLDPKDYQKLVLRDEKQAVDDA